jgi:hypothetical protein
MEESEHPQSILASVLNMSEIETKKDLPLSQNSV